MHSDLHCLLSIFGTRLYKKSKQALVLEQSLFYWGHNQQHASTVGQNHFSDECRFVDMAATCRTKRVTHPAVWSGLGGEIMQSLDFILVGAIAMASMTTGVFFLRFWKMTKDRFFLFFAASFLIEGVNRFFLGFMNDPSDDSIIYYMVRLLSYSLILIAVIDKNLPRKDK
jgi:hypothetical protein